MISDPGLRNRSYIVSIELIWLLLLFAKKPLCTFPVNISKPNWQLLICFAKNLICSTLKTNFSICWLFFYPPDIKYLFLSQIKRNHTSVESLWKSLRWSNLQKWTFMTEGHILYLWVVIELKKISALSRLNEKWELIRSYHVTICFAS